MNRFIATGVVGACLLMVGHAGLSLGVRPEGLAPIGHLVQGCLALVLGTALFVSGMLGLAEGYEKACASLRDLLPRKQQPADLEVAAPAHLDESVRRFWGGYHRAAAGICVFLAGLLGLTLALAGTSQALYMTGVGVGVAAMASGALFLSIGGMRRMRRSHLRVARSAAILAEQPDREPERTPPKPRRLPAYTLFKQRGRYSREVESRRGRAPASP